MNILTYIAIDCIGDNLPRKKVQLVHSLRKSRCSLDQLSARDLQWLLRLKKTPPPPKELFHRAEKIQSAMEQMGIRGIPFSSSEYPQLLREIYDAPFLLYWQGRSLYGAGVENLGGKRVIGQGDPEDTPLPTFSVVGSRKAPYQAAEAAFSFGLELALSRVVLVSGFAYGIDIAAHLGALAGKGRAIVVLGSGHRYLSPRVHRKYKEQTLNLGGAIISEYPPDQPSRKYYFPQRNRIISGLSLWTLLVGVPERSGALITADFALEQGREVFVHPLGAELPWGAGGGTLIASGAPVIDHVDQMGAWVESLPFSPVRVAEIGISDYTIKRMVDLELEGCIYRYRTKRFQQIL